MCLVFPLLHASCRGRSSCWMESPRLLCPSAFQKHYIQSSGFSQCSPQRPLKNFRDLVHLFHLRSSGLVHSPVFSISCFDKQTWRDALSGLVSLLLRNVCTQSYLPVQQVGTPILRHPGLPHGCKDLNDGLSTKSTSALKVGLVKFETRKKSIIS